MVASAPTTVRFRVSGSVMLSLAIVVIGSGVMNGASAILVRVPE